MIKLKGITWDHARGYDPLIVASALYLKETGIQIEWQKRSLTNFGDQSLETLAQQFDLIINATSTSLTGQLPPLPADILAENGVCYDLAYSNEATTFVRWGQENNALKSLDGLGMLVEQAAEAFFIWRGVRPRTEPIIKLLNDERLR